MEMSKVPPILLAKLAQLRRRERLLRLVWGGARLLRLVLAVLVLACLVDWIFDLWDETPWGLRVFMLRGAGGAGGIGLRHVRRASAAKAAPQ